MRRLLLLTMFTILTLNSVPALAAGETVNVKVLGLVCEFCAQTIEKVFMDTGEVETVDVDLNNAIIKINMKDGEAFSDDDITGHIKDAGYAVEDIRHMPETRDE